MNTGPLDPYGAALLAFFDGDEDAELIIRREDGLAVPMPVGHFFREPDAFTPLEVAALDGCTGRVLDAGAGTGLHSLDLQERGLAVTAIDICPQAVELMSRRGVRDVQVADIFTYDGGPFDTILMLGHGIGMVETLDGLDRFLARAPRLLAPRGRVVLDSLDVRRTDDPRHVAYHDAVCAAGRYVGEVRLRLEFAGAAGADRGWLHVDPDTLNDHAGRAGFTCTVLTSDEHGNHVARLDA
jgi:SAM-dependent methyltransferase